MKKKNIKVLFFITWPYEDASSRYRVYQYEDIIVKNNVAVLYDVLFPSWLWRNKNRSEIWFHVIKLLVVCAYLLRRIFRIFRSWRYDVVFIHREVFPFFTPFFENLVRKMAKRIIFDFDDAIFLKPDKWKNWRDILRKPEKVREVCKIVDCIIVGNKYLYNYAVQFNNNVVIIPTVYNVTLSEKRIENQIPVIGWLGSWSTLINLNIVSGALEKLSHDYDFIFRIVGAKNIYSYSVKNVKVDYIEWNLDKEREYLNSFDIGIMPLYDLPWERGKCAFKLIQYMSLCIPVVASPVGTNLEVVEHGESGYFASTEDEWIYYLSLLLKDKSLRIKMGKKGRKVIESKYSYSEASKKFYKVLVNELYKD